MKKLLIAFLLFALLLPTSALAEPRTIDLSTMTLDELTVLKNEVSAAITNLSAEVVDGYALVENYGEYARNPDPHVGEKIRFNGSVVQVIEGVESTTYRIAMKGNSDYMFYVEYTPEGDAPRVLEEDKVTVMGEFTGLVDYESTFGGQITIPGMTAENITPEVKAEMEYEGTRQDPVPVGATFHYSGDDYYNTSVTDLTVTSVIRGAAAWDIVRSFYRYNDKPGKDEEYVIVYVKTAVISSPDNKPVEFSSYNFTFVSETGAAYDSASVYKMTPELKDLYAGAENEGVVAAIVPKEDKPMLVYLRNSDTPVWFDLNKRKPISLDPNVVLTTLQKGDSGDGVLAIQQKLVELGYLSGTPDGNFGKKTVEAIKKYQGDMGLEATGIADDATQRLILTGQLPQ
jgi:hypothetical protein